MTPEERAHVVVTARLLRAAASVQWLAVGLTVVACVVVIVAPVGGRTTIPAIASIVLGLVAIFHGFRVSFDAKLFEDIIEQRLTTTELDTALAALSKPKGDRDWIERCRGARRLVVRLAIAVLLQVIAVMFIGWA